MPELELIDCEEYNKIYPEDVEFWAWVESMEQAYVKSITINQQS